ncbi:MAG: GNAT family N-acetyltransferase [Planctomycetota bacterium]
MARPVARPPAGVRVRAGRSEDNEGLLDLAAACPMQAAMTVRVRREPDFFALSRLQGERWNIGVAEAPGGRIAGCICVAERRAYLWGVPTPTMYVSDLKVLPEFRGLGVADALTQYARGVCEAVDPEILALATALAGNRAMERRAAGPRGMPLLGGFATVRLHSVVLLRARHVHVAHLQLTRAEERDLEEMAALWRRVALGRQLAPVLTVEALARRIAAAPGLEVSSYWLARRASGALAGFMALWDQHQLKETQVLRYSWRAAAFRRAYNAAATLLGAPPLPRAGTQLRYVSAFHTCIPAGAPEVLRALLVAAGNEARRGGYTFVNLGLDVRDPLRAAVRGLWSFSTDIRAYATTPQGRYVGPPLDDRPLHFETALV